ncbi:MAG: hypothetical protein JWR69_2648 [Pedosphaera sp.]|nr:hypothetical protein [Pedosphaera sp.]
MTTIAITILLSGILIFILSLPLINRKVPMNGGYGIRIPAAFESEQRWYDINAYGGRRLAAWSWLIMTAGAVGFFVSPEHKDAYVLASVAVTLLAVTIPVFQLYRWSRKK